MRARILRGLGSRALPCGCLVGLYETYNTQTVAVIDAKGALCPLPDHHVNQAVKLPAFDPQHTPAMAS